MPEALAVVAVFVVAVVAWLGAWLHARDPANTNAGAEMERLRHHAVWLQQRLEVARREGWGEEMVTNLADELNSTARQLEQTDARN